MNPTSRVERLERALGAGRCPCREARQIQIIRDDEDDAAPGGPCGLCGEPLPVTRIVVVRPGGE